MLIKGADLNVVQRGLVLRAFVYRWTEENRHQTYRGECPGCAQMGGFPCVTGSKGARKVWERAEWHAYHVPLTTDAAWLADHAFHFLADGSRLAGKQHAEPVYMADRRERVG